MCMEFDRGNCALSDVYIYIYIYIYIYAAMLRVSLSFSWFYLEVGGGSWICGKEQVEAVSGSTFKVNGAPN